MTTLFSRMLVGVDDSEPSRDAVTLAARLAREHDGQLILAHVVNVLPSVAFEAPGAIVDIDAILRILRERGRAMLARAVEIAKNFGVDAEPRILEGEPAEVLDRLAAETYSRLIVMGTHGRRGVGRLYLGSTTEAVLRADTIPVLTVRTGERIADPTRRCFERILVGIDESEPSDAAAETVLDFPAEDRRQVMFYSIADKTDLLHDEAQQIVDHAVTLARTRDVSAEGRVVDGSAGDALVAAVQERHADLLVLGSHGRRGIERFFLGSVAENVVRVAPVPVLVVRTRNGVAAA